MQEIVISRKSLDLPDFDIPSWTALLKRLGQRTSPPDDLRILIYYWSTAQVSVTPTIPIVDSAYTNTQVSIRIVEPNSLVCYHSLLAQPSPHKATISMRSPDSSTTFSQEQHTPHQVGRFSELSSWLSDRLQRPQKAVLLGRSLWTS